jgi:hypothetical protein
MKKYFLVSLFLFYSYAASFSQTAGYMGKRFIFTHSSLYFFAFKEPSFRKNQGKINATQCLGLEFVATRKYTLCVAVNHALTGTTYQPQNNYSNAYHEQGDGLPPPKVSMIQLSLGLKRFNRKVVAPIGFYMKWELLYQQYTTRYNPDGFYTYFHYYSAYSGQYSKADGGSGKAKSIGIGSAYSVGKQRIYAHKIVVDYGVRFSITVPLRNYLTNAVEKSIADNASYRMLDHQLLNFKIGIGFLAF